MVRTPLSVLIRDEVRRLWDCLDGVQSLLRCAHNDILMAQLLKFHQPLPESFVYGSGLRLMECVRLRIQDVGFEYRIITVRDGRGEKDRIVPLPEMVTPELRRQNVSSSAAACGAQPAGLSGARSNWWTSYSEDRGRGMGDGEMGEEAGWYGRRTEEFRRNPGPPESVESIGTPFAGHRERKSGPAGS